MCVLDIVVFRDILKIGALKVELFYFLVSFIFRALNSSLAESSKNVWDFLIALNEDLRPRTATDFQSMLELKQMENSLATVSSEWF